MLRLPPPVRETFARELDEPRLGLLTRLNQLAGLVIAIRTAVVAVGCNSQAMGGPEQQEALRPLAALGQRLRPIFLQMVVAEGLPTNSTVGDREFRWARRATRLSAHTVQLAANSSTPPRSFTLANVLNFCGRSHNEALASLVGLESMAVPGRFAPAPAGQPAGPVQCGRPARRAGARRRVPSREPGGAER